MIRLEIIANLNNQTYLRTTLVSYICIALLSTKVEYLLQRCVAIA